VQSESTFVVADAGRPNESGRDPNISAPWAVSAWVLGSASGWSATSTC